MKAKEQYFPGIDNDRLVAGLALTLLGLLLRVVVVFAVLVALADYFQGHPGYFFLLACSVSLLVFSLSLINPPRWGRF